MLRASCAVFYVCIKQLLWDNISTVNVSCGDCIAQFHLLNMNVYILLDVAINQLSSSQLERNCSVNGQQSDIQFHQNDELFLSAFPGKNCTYYLQSPCV
jgi:hypothetical protein